MVELLKVFSDLISSEEFSTTGCICSAEIDLAGSTARVSVCFVSLTCEAAFKVGSTRSALVADTPSASACSS
ncbi:hypothetical protein D9M71_639920 [compost metagenome]